MDEERYPALPWQGWKIVKGWDEAVMAVCIWHSGIRRVSWKMLL